MTNNTIILSLGCYDPEIFEVKSISAAWNKARELRDSQGWRLDGKILQVILPDGKISKRIPKTILFRANKNGKIEFRDFDKVKAFEERQIQINFLKYFRKSENN